ncbi:MAG TPA: GNAT family N-acetyltransferase [Pyrinomonadaceae bacterium]
MSIELAEGGKPIVPTLGPRLDSLPLSIHLLTDGNEAEALAFLAGRPLHTVCLSGLILDNGLVSSLNRGDFYACRDAAGRMEGIALIGHATLFEAQTDAAIEAFAHLAQDNPRAHLIRGEREIIEHFRGHYMPGGNAPRQVCSELLLEQRQSFLTEPFVSNLRQATLDDLETVLEVNAALIYDECGVNPFQTDLAGFRQRTARRIGLGRVWVWIEKERLIYKTDLISVTPEVIYLEGVYVDPSERGKGYGFRCFSELCHILLEGADSICLLVNEQNQAALNLYQKVGYTLQGYYDTIYLPRKIF